MRKEYVLFLSWALILSAMMFVVNPTVANPIPKSMYQSASLLDNDPFFQSDDEVFNQFKTMQQAMDRLMQHQFKQFNNASLGFMNSKSTLNPSQDIKMEEHNNELTYTIKQPEGSESKIDVSVKDGLMIVNTFLIQKTTHSEHGSKSYSYSQRNYTQSFKLPSGYDPNSMDMKSKNSNLIVTFKKHYVPNSLKT
ncbi:Hsp20 family protein [Legionella quateirensis]|uniref:Heat shock hsp20 n=1 Tax=Legionella quateirensis TaxID=45072 RepID=A0A378KPV9_9GAMM|nr:Hsp20 family protein [Legionella quateirensis]KTD52884.1 heat shock hsp20 [Legionella quateirensis]STY16386.1 Heat shock hsp20 [Legionella quateirensis]